MIDFDKVQLSVPQRTLLLKVISDQTKIKIKGYKAQDSGSTPGGKGADQGEVTSGFRGHFRDALELLMKLPSGYELVKQTAEGKFEVEIFPTKRLTADANGLPIGGSVRDLASYEKAVEAEVKKAGGDGTKGRLAVHTTIGCCDAKKGSASRFFFHEKFDDNMMQIAEYVAKANKFNPKGPAIWSKTGGSIVTPLFICVGHELIHARRMQLGVNAAHDLECMDYLDATKNAAGKKMTDGDRKKIKNAGYVNREEFETVEGPAGIKGPKGDINENTLRAEAGLAARKQYTVDAHLIAWDDTKGHYEVKQGAVVAKT